MFIAQGFKKDSEFWKYLLGSLIVFIASIMGQVPLLLAILVKSFTSKKMPSAESDIYKLFEPNLLLFLILISFVFALVGLYFVVRKLHNQSFISVVTSRNKIDWKRVFFAFGIWALFSSSMIVTSYFVDPSEIKLQFNLIPFLILAVITLVLMPIQTSTEELVFRGYLMQGFFNLARNKWFPLVMTSVIFGTMHIFNPEVQKMGYLILVYYIGTGLFLGIITLMDEGTELALGFHAANNMMAALLITSDFTVFQTHSVFKDLSEPSLDYEAFLPVFVIYPLLIFLFSKVYKWKNWNEKLIGNHKNLQFQELEQIQVQNQEKE
ncbi:CPBP family intramembrane metalloprotease [Flavobacterium sp. HXWNR29]|uniref:CPBP family intramembrane glutamic endopeptidase n=1 Tax=Flavobacterium odoriferum TaxID=2946604 RepID=UPI0021CB0157|nr:CPBP family intramembrane glutamic endopeptidase [Flavobacterium sp. HXWNR29]MCU4189230.1 CPBP family intramembrane metalloprotease [Flavobacterium sp. HXWNR29]